MTRKITAQGFLLTQILVFGAVAVLVLGGLASFAGANVKLGRRVALSEQAFQMAEAGIEYYRWHLAHAPNDFTDGTGLPGPYVKEFRNASGTLLGTFTLEILPPGLGSTLVEVRSTGTSAQDSSVTRTIFAQLAVASFANFAVATNANEIRFGAGTEVFGPIHSNGGIRFDGVAHNLVTSALANYDDPDHGGGDEFGVHTHISPVDPLPPAQVPARPDVFLAGRSFPVPTVNFSVIADDLPALKDEAQTNGRYFGSSNDDGYRIVLRTDDTFNLYRVTSLQNTPGGCSADSQTGWGTWSVNNSTLLGNYAFPENGLIFLEDHVWVEGTIDGARITIIAARPNSSQTKSITINSDVRYTHYDGTDTLALIAQNNVNVGLFSADNLRIDAALVAQNGRVGRFSYSDTQCTNRIRNSLTLYGTIITAQRYGFTYGNPPSSGNGYINRNLIYDPFLLYNAPPFFPVIDDYHEVITWKEV